MQELQHAPGFQDVNTDQQNSGLQALLTYDRPTAARLGLTPQLVDRTLYDAFGQAEVSTIYTQLNQYYVVMEVAPKYWQSPHGLKDTYLIPTAGGGEVPIGTVSKYTASTAPLAVNHTGLFPSVTRVVQPGAGCLARPGGAGNRQHPAEAGDAAVGAVASFRARWRHSSSP